MTGLFEKLGRPYIVAFYSPLGGVWRSTMTLLTATAIAEVTGENVLAVDFDATTPTLLAYLSRDDVLEYQKPLLERRYYSLLDAVNAGRAPPRPGMELPVAPWTRRGKGRVYVLPATSWDTLREARRVTFLRYGLDAMMELASRLRNRIIQGAAREIGAGVVVADMGPGFHQFNQAGLRAADAITLLSRADVISLRRVATVLPLLRKERILRPWPPEAGEGFGAWEYRPHRLYMIYTHVPLSRETNKDASKDQEAKDKVGSAENVLKELRERLRSIHEKLRVYREREEDLPLMPRLPERFAVVPLIEELLSPPRFTEEESNSSTVGGLRPEGGHVRLVYERRKEWPYVLPWMAAREVADVILGWISIETKIAST